ncbi:MAG: ABC-F type ribosomal protection protein [Candidatus Cloacimonetes bacterium]|nr:ABC-F type ribosomal protection protein [Candidatus Cloacimonadota bacterium]MCF7815241.1 ABC-F type ribosomal protection protein [Candidatus Cloacimonadota bacterium]MCF7867320.1 ABC-F type ribosomal protection protein [Candidatus Cloacimonadota bacterium]MCF7884710.1 ABC-F type ribosomal protection protein [Candidatus Cloacimonadota bacterium]
MAIIKAGNITFCYEDQAENLFEELSLEIGSNTKAGLIGKNGCGKSTLFSILLQKYKPIAGGIYFQPNLRTGYLPQEVVIPDDLIVQDFLWMLKPRLFNLKKKMEKLDQFKESEMIKILADFDTFGGYKFDIHFQKVMSQFSLDSTFLNRKLSTLSGGEKTKIAFCRIMLDEPDLLLLDEPTNHLDVQTLEWLESYLNKIKIPFLVISHDRKFLDNCVQEIWEMENKTITKFSGNYSFYRKEKDKAFQRKLHQYESSQKKIKKLKKAFIDRKDWAVSHQAQTGSEGYAPVYETITNSAKDSMRRAKAVETRLNKEIEKAQDEKPWIEKKREIHFEDQEIRARTILRVEKLSKNFVEESVLKDLSFTVENGERFLISGKNGSGKSTLLKILVDQIKEFEGEFSWNPQVKIGYYAQEIEELNPENTILEEMIEGDMTKQSQARTVLGSFNLRKDKVHQKIGSLSIGEKSKTALKKIIISDTNVLVLDEPTNHLEIAAREALEVALMNFKGTIIFVSHDRYLCEKLGENEINLDVQP